MNDKTVGEIQELVRSMIDDVNGRSGADYLNSEQMRRIEETEQAIKALITEAREDSYSECFRIIKEVNDKLFMYETIFGKIDYDYNGTDTVERFKQYQELEPERVKFGNWLEEQEAQLKENK